MKIGKNKDDYILINYQSNIGKYYLFIRYII